MTTLSWSGCFSILTWKQINPVNTKLLCPVCGYFRKHPGLCKQRCSFIIGKLAKISWSQCLGFVAEQTGRNRDSSLIIFILSFHFRNNTEQSKAESSAPCHLQEQLWLRHSLGEIKLFDCSLRTAYESDCA